MCGEWKTNKLRDSKWKDREITDLLAGGNFTENREYDASVCCVEVTTIFLNVFLNSYVALRTVHTHYLWNDERYFGHRSV